MRNNKSVYDSSALQQDQSTTQMAFCNVPLKRWQGKGIDEDISGGIGVARDIDYAKGYKKDVNTYILQIVVLAAFS